MRRAEVALLALLASACGGGKTTTTTPPANAAPAAPTSAPSKAACNQLLEHLVDLELGRAGVTEPERSKQKAAVVEAKSAEFIDVCVNQTPKQRVDCALAAHDLEAVAMCDEQK